jgi:hypothetical protein
MITKENLVKLNFLADYIWQQLQSRIKVSFNANLENIYLAVI